MVFTLAVGCLAHYALNYISNLGADARNTTDFWTDMVASATGQAMIVCITLGAAIACLFSDVSWKKKAFAVVSLII
ncbi:MAG: hypothetical protein IIU82_06440, partial [Tidjanibacter sp.]|nr:hypothetical protein [Tidjanibacter sp.]